MRDGGVDLHALIGADTALTRAANGRHGIEYAGSCPFCGGTDRLRVQPEWDGGRWWCRRCSGSDHWGDAADYLARRDNLSLGEALDRARGLPAAPPRPAPAPDDVPSEGWRRSVGGLIDAWQEALWAPDGARALAWLRARGLRDETLRAARLGYIAADAPPGSEMGYRRGIALPSVGADGALYGVRIRRPVPEGARGADKYHSVRGSRKCLYGHFRAQATLLVVEGEFDCLLAAQHVGHLADVATMAPPSSSPDGRWQRTLCGYRRILVCLDADDAGRHGLRRWAWSGRVRPVPVPAGKDATEAVVRHGVDLVAWLGDLLDPWDDAAKTRLAAEVTAYAAGLFGADPAGATALCEELERAMDAGDAAAFRALRTRVGKGERYDGGDG